MKLPGLMGIKMTAFVKTHTVRSTWLGRAGLSVSFLLNTNVVGLRVSAVIWEDGGDVDVRLIKGDGRKANFQTFRTATVPTGDIEAIRAVAEGLVTDHRNHEASVAVMASEPDNGDRFY